LIKFYYVIDNLGSQLVSMKEELEKIYLKIMVCLLKIWNILLSQGSKASGITKEKKNKIQLQGE